MQEAKNYISVDDMAAEFGVNRATAWRWVKQRGIETVRFLGDRKTYVHRDDVAVLRQPIPAADRKQKEQAV